MRKKIRLDSLLVELQLAETIENARKLIMSGRVLVKDTVVDKSGTLVAIDAAVRLTGMKSFVGRGAVKLSSALQDFSLQVTGLICADVGSSTGGFTEVLLNAGAVKVYAIDVGYNELDYKLRKDPRVVVMERTNARHVDRLPEPVGLVTIDVSFISLRLILPIVKNWLSRDGQILALMKPQFEANAAEVGEGGVIKDAALHQRLLQDFAEWSDANGFDLLATHESAITGAKGNREFFMLFKPVVQ